MTILENSKILMYEFFYNYLKASYGPRCDLIYTDTDRVGGSFGAAFKLAGLVQIPHIGKRWQFFFVHSNGP